MSKSSPATLSCVAKCDESISDGCRCCDIHTDMLPQVSPKARIIVEGARGYSCISSGTGEVLCTQWYVQVLSLSTST